MTNKPVNPKTKNILKILLSLLAKLGLFFILSLFFLFLLRILPGSITYEYSHEPTAELAVTEIPSPELFTLRLQDGELFVFDKGGEIIKPVSLDISSLGEYDIQLLSRGIVADAEELRRLIDELFS